MVHCQSGFNGVGGRVWFCWLFLFLTHGAGKVPHGFGVCALVYIWVGDPFFDKAYLDLEQHL